jgi:hypothetical protein
VLLKVDPIKQALSPDADDFLFGRSFCIDLADLLCSAIADLGAIQQVEHNVGIIEMGFDSSRKHQIKKDFKFGELRNRTAQKITNIPNQGIFWQFRLH